MKPKPKEISSFKLQRQSPKYFSTQPTQGLLSFTQYDGSIGISYVFLALGERGLAVFKGRANLLKLPN